MQNVRNLWIDSDTASDDAVAILMALRSEVVNVLGISIVSGNVDQKQGAVNARYTVQLCEKDTPVYIGSGKPFIRPVKHATSFHGDDGMGNMHYSVPEINENRNGVLAMIDTIKAHKNNVDLVTLGPLTNVALALMLEPEITEWVSQCYIMGGAACTVGNTTPAAEYNIWCDPEAASVVFNSGLPILMVGWEHCRGENAIVADDITKIKEINTVYGQFLLDCNRSLLENFIIKYGDPGIPLPDPITMAIAINRSVCAESSSCFVDISLDKELTRGMTVVDQLKVTQNPPNVEVCWTIDTFLWKQVLFDSLN